MSRLLTFALAGALTASIAVNVASRSCDGCVLCSHPSPAQMQECLDCLALTPAQCAELQAECGSSCGASQALEQRIAALQTELRAALHAEPLDEARVRGLAARLGDLRRDAVLAGVGAALQMRAVLTSSQLAALEQTLGAAAK
jgi:Spy/CpxP family protein refolding chaperone